MADDTSSTTEREELEELVRGIVVAQGNVFVKELLSEKGIRIGTTKAGSERNMLGAIEAGGVGQR